MVIDDRRLVVMLPSGRVAHIATKDQGRPEEWASRTVTTLCGQRFVARAAGQSMHGCPRCYDRARRSESGGEGEGR